VWRNKLVRDSLVGDSLRVGKRPVGHMRNRAHDGALRAMKVLGDVLIVVQFERHSSQPWVRGAYVPEPLPRCEHSVMQNPLVSGPAGLLPSALYVQFGCGVWRASVVLAGMSE
jgi:hypothetical protein